MIGEDSYDWRVIEVRVERRDLNAKRKEKKNVSDLRSLATTFAAAEEYGSVNIGDMHSRDQSKNGLD